MGRELQQHMLPDSTFSLLISARPYIDCPGASPLLCLSIIDSCLDIEHLHAQESFLTTTTPPCLSSSAPPAPRATSPSPSTAPSPRPPSSTSKKPRAVRPPLLLLLPLLPPLANPPSPGRPPRPRRQLRDTQARPAASPESRRQLLETGVGVGE